MADEYLPTTAPSDLVRSHCASPDSRRSCIAIGWKF